MRFRLSLLLIISLLIVQSLAGNCASHTWWESRDMFHCSGDSWDYISWDGSKSTLRVPGGNDVRTLIHCVRFCDYATSTFVVELGEVSPGVSWELAAVPLDDNAEQISLIKGTGGGSHRVALNKLGLPRWSFINAELRFWSQEPGSAEILRLAVETTRPNKSAKQHAYAKKALARATPMERGLVPHWNSEIGGFVCAYNATHPEHYNYWLEDEGELLWALGNYPKMMELYGEPLRDFIVKYCKAGAPVRRVNDQPLSANIFLRPGVYSIDTGAVHVKGNLAEDPHINFHPSVYENGGLLASIADFFVSYRTSTGSSGVLKFDKPGRYDIEYDKPKKDAARLRIDAEDKNISARFIFDVYCGRVTASVDVSNTGVVNVEDITAGFTFRNCEGYFRSPINRLKQFGNVALLYSEQHASESCSIVRISGPVSKSIALDKRDDGVVRQAAVSAPVAASLFPWKRVPLKLADINAGSTCFIDKVEMYKDVDFAEVEISMSHVGTYALLGLATYSYRYPEDNEARQVTNMMIDNFLQARNRSRDRELGYLLWALNLLGRDKDAAEIADVAEKRARARDLGDALDSSAMAIGLRAAGRWDAAAYINSQNTNRWGSIGAPTEVVGYGCMQSESGAEKCYHQLSTTLQLMYWDEPDRLTGHNERRVEEGPQEIQAYALIAFDFMRRHYGEVMPVRLDPFKETKITKMSYDEATGDWRASLIKTGEVDIFTSFRLPKRVLWNGQEAPAGSWSYDENTGVVYFKGLSGDGELTITVDHIEEKPEPGWEPIDYIGLNKKPK